MSKELEYEVNNFANLLHKDCMNLMECLKNQSEDNKPILYLGKHYQKIILPYEEYQKICNRLETIENAEPSEALECSLKLYKMVESAGNGNGFSLNEAWKYHTTIKQALLKSPEPFQTGIDLGIVKPKQYLKWEDLKFEHTPKYIDVKMSGNKYKLVVGYNVAGKNLAILRDGKNEYYFLEFDKQFFNDLHLERVLE